MAPIITAVMRRTIASISALSILFYCGCAQDFVLTVEPNWSTLFTGESVTLIWDMREGEGTDWYYTILKDGQEYDNIYNALKMSYKFPPLSTRHSGEYQCFGRHKRIAHYQKQSTKVSLTVAANDVILENPASTLYEGESVTLRCRHRTQNKTNVSFYKDGSLIELDTNQQRQIISENAVEITIQPLSDGSSYMCRFDEDEESQPIKLKMEANRPKAELKIAYRDISIRGNVTLKCSVASPSSGWKYFWYRGAKTSEPLTTQDVVFLSNETIRVSKGGVYWCRGGRGNPVYYTEYSIPIATNRPVVTLQPSWPKIYDGEMITLRCDIENGEDTEWKYEWLMHSSYTHKKQNENMIRFVQSSQTEQYMCLGRTESEMSTTQWSDSFILTLSDKPLPVLTVSPLWLNAGDSVTLKCEVEHPSAGWRFYWYKTVPKLPGNSYSPELLPGSSKGTEQDSYIVHGQTGTAGYVCRAGRGDPVYYTQYSHPQFVWSGDFPSSVSLTVSPDRVQHFTSESVSLNCEGNSPEWRVMRLYGNSYLSDCSSWGTMTGSTCNINRYRQIDAVFWCESGSGEFSNAVNISKQYRNIILLSPVHPVTEGDPVSLSCKLRTGVFVSNVFFYRNDELIQNDARKELNISAVSKSDEGSYKCRHSGEESSQSWMSVKAVSRPESSSFNVGLIVGPVCGIILLLLLLLLFLLHRYRPSKNSCFIRQSQSERTNQGSDTNQVVNQNEAQGDEYATPLHGDAAVYASIKGSEDNENVGGGSQDVTYSLLELKNIKKKRKQHGPEESSVYSDVKTRTADDNLMYAQVKHHNKGKGKKTKGIPHPAPTEAIYSEVKPGTSLGL